MSFGCNFHDIKAKGISDYEGSSRDKQLFSGHKTESRVLVYDRKVKNIPFPECTSHQSDRIVVIKLNLD